MRKRGWILLLATLPIWVYAVFGCWHYEQSKHIGGNWYFEDMPLPLTLHGAVWVLFVLTLVAFVVLLFDSISWFRGRHDRKNQTN